MSDVAGPTVVVGAAMIRGARLLAARRVAPADVAGGWELPGGKVEADESLEEAVVREVAEELGCLVRVVGWLDGEAPVKPGYVLRVAVTRWVSGEIVPTEHDAVRWLSGAQLDDVPWLQADVPFLPQLRLLLERGR